MTSGRIIWLGPKTDLSHLHYTIYHAYGHDTVAVTIEERLPFYVKSKRGLTMSSA